jgi:ATP-binding cassette subfamily B protein
VYIGLECFHGLFLFGMRRTMIVASRKIEYDFRNDFFGHLQNLHIHFFQYARTGDMMSRASNDLANVREVLGPGIMYTANMVVSFAFVVPMMIAIDGWLTLIVFLPLLILSLGVNRLATVMHKRAQTVQEKLSDISARAQETFSGIRIIKAFALEMIHHRKFDDLNQEYIQSNLSMVRIRGLMMSSVILTIGMSIAALLWYGGSLVMAKSISLGDFTAFSFYLAMLIWPMFALGWVINIFQRGSASVKRMNEILQTPPAITDAKQNPAIQRIQGKIHFNGLTFAYQHQPVLHHIDLLVEPGMSIGVVGLTGSGKSTLVNLIPRLYVLPENQLFIDDHEIHEIPLHTLRSSIGIVPQDPFLFSDSIRQNILFGNPDATNADIEWAAELAQIHVSIMEFPDQYETVIGERGITLSGGQKQRLAIARAVIRKPPVLILDDALSSVDTQTEDSILSGLMRLMKDRTTLMVSHRIRTIQHADRIIYLADGRITERGTHEELVALNGSYAAMYKHQLLEEEITKI